MRKKVVLSLLAASVISSTYAATEPGFYPITPIQFTQVKVKDASFWGDRIKANREVTIPLAFNKCETEGRIENLVKAANPSLEYKVGGFSFDDTYVYKTIEVASYAMQIKADQKLSKYIDSFLTID